MPLGEPPALQPLLLVGPVIIVARAGRPATILSSVLAGCSVRLLASGGLAGLLGMDVLANSHITMHYGSFMMSN